MNKTDQIVSIMSRLNAVDLRNLAHRLGQPVSIIVDMAIVAFQESPFGSSLYDLKVSEIPSFDTYRKIQAIKSIRCALEDEGFRVDLKSAKEFCDGTRKAGEVIPGDLITIENLKKIDELIRPSGYHLVARS